MYNSNKLIKVLNVVFVLLFFSAFTMIFVYESKRTDMIFGTILVVSALSLVILRFITKLMTPIEYESENDLFKSAEHESTKMTRRASDLLSRGFMNRRK